MAELIDLAAGAQTRQPSARWRERKRRGQRGYVLLAVLLALTLLALAMATAVPALTTQIRREREIEMIHRGEQYARAVRRYYRKFGRYPTRLEELEKTNNIRFLRKRYKDPMSPNGNWRLVRLGDIRLGGSGPNTGVNPAQGLQPNPAASGGTPSQLGGGGGTDGSGTTGGSSTTAGSSMTGGSTTGSSNSNNQIFGGGGIIGVASPVDKKGIHEFNNKSSYKDWYFVYDPAQDRGQLLKGPYNPNAFMGANRGGNSNPGGPAPTTSPQGNLPNIPGVSTPGGMFPPK